MGDGGQKRKSITVFVFGGAVVVLYQSLLAETLDKGF